MSDVHQDVLHFPAASRTFLASYLPSADQAQPGDCLYPFTTVTFATSLDSQLALSPGAQTVLSGPQSKAMTHYLRSQHDAILVGVGTAVADNPGLNCRIEGVGGYGSEGLVGQPQPIIIDPHARWDFTETSKIFQLAREGKGRAPYIITTLSNPPVRQAETLEKAGGKFIKLPLCSGKLEWRDILRALKVEGLQSVMIEGGAAVINDLLVPGNSSIVNSVIVTIAPTWLGVGGVVVSPPRRVEEGRAITSTRLRHVQWYPLGEDVVLCGNFRDP
ncbi:2,5-diamino-6-(ribosylamino)-4(3H)-pyrimidinone 5'-phosphate reductase [Cadophora gregata]|uniref:2,5-diamino-6-(ribosylamino)-4(3H)-pyrimidinone 5'-phosphate reductase n=1 Tax=Cadophora gregata TaxID=51156 RepID=UPI0026DAE10A|nr:2,5-diamino-6-(ribosylamino)-4(3H)-pyrimidinone 5'-phosphate reductase [Cadophora gregata]KAK0117790.1 2,5-diamino-6-(ribosylamino)-4(3H)-pyrimidinone 5'-phosphate reductase [Cadophora gregata]KAK0122842.1 2,5-diamino-6-(ribosylamino)-4(3H)-pyrimidinone 5'-phosphate reductase [Cadophora gregata f. sp. sojae]